MLISEFAEKYNTSKQKDAFVKKHIKTTYIPYYQKIDAVRQIVKATMYKNINGKDTFVINSPLRYFLFVRTVIELYTDLEWDKFEKEKEIDGFIVQYDISKDFDILEQNGLIESIMNAIGDDFTKFTTVLNMVVDDEVDLNRSIIPFFETKFEAVSMLLNTFEQALQTPEIKSKITQFIKGK